MTSNYAHSANVEAESRRITSSPGPSNVSSDNFAFRQQLTEHIHKLGAEITDYDMKIKRLQEERHACINERNELQRQREDYMNKGRTSAPQRRNASNTGINYEEDVFDWSDSLEQRLRSVFGIQNFRLCQRGVCNAAMDERDVVCIMPTGGGKSLTYQLPATFGRGITLVISPLISLISDQIMHLRQAGVEAVKLTGSTSKTDNNDIMRRLRAAADRTLRDEDNPIKLCYVTPEKIAKSASLKSMLERLAKSHRLDRIVVDEAHCVSQLGHDFRPDYNRLHVLRGTICPNVPITALSATCPPEVLSDLVKILGLRPVADGQNAPPNCTTVFTAPLYRKNLHYAVIRKPAKSEECLKWIAQYIEQSHPNQSGIVYCCSKKDTEDVAAALNASNIKTGVYHADRPEREKEALHQAWHEGSIKVVCATIAFGLGIDKADVRFVIHEKISKSLDGYYQESGRAGRDGKDAECFLLYRPQDYSTLGSLVADEMNAQKKLKAMVRFAQDNLSCRKVQFVNYFSFSANLSSSSWATEEVGAHDRCGHCDNCQREVTSVDQRDVTIEAWQILKVTENLTTNDRNVTVAKLANYCRGKGISSLSVSTKGGKGKARAQKQARIYFGLEEICEGSVDLPPEETERLIIHLLIEGYLGERIHRTAYNTIVYLVPGPHALSLTRRSRKADLAPASANMTKRVKFCFLKPERKKKQNPRLSRSEWSTIEGNWEELVHPSEGRSLDYLQNDDDEDQSDFDIRPSRSRKKALSRQDDSLWEEVIGDHDPDTTKVASPSTSRILPPSHSRVKNDVIVISDEELDGEAQLDDAESSMMAWQANQRGVILPGPSRKRPRPSTSTSREIIDIPDDSDGDILE